MRRVRIDDVDTYMGPASVKRPLSTELETEGLSINYFELEPGESFAFGYHSHADQEEVFYVRQGVVTFEAGSAPTPTVETSETVTANGESANGGSAATDEPAAKGEPSADADRIDVGPGEAVRFAPGEYQCGSNESGDRVVALALGAPRDAGETDIRRECSPCGEYTSQEIEMTDDRDALVTRCVECEAETGRFE
jgi:quercetin dioxygenase-like cupin family protein